MPKQLKDVIKQARIQKGYTQEELAELVGVQKSAVAKWENGRVSEIKKSNLLGLAQALDISLSSLVGEIKEKPTADDDGPSDEIEQLIERIKILPAEKVRLLLQVAESIK